MYEKKKTIVILKIIRFVGSKAKKISAISKIIEIMNVSGARGIFNVCKALLIIEFYFLDQLNLLLYKKTYTLIDKSLINISRLSNKKIYLY